MDLITLQEKETELLTGGAWNRRRQQTSSPSHNGGNSGSSGGSGDNGGGVANTIPSISLTSSPIYFFPKLEEDFVFIGYVTGTIGDIRL